MTSTSDTTYTFDPLGAEALADPGKAYSELRARCPFHHHQSDTHDFYVTSRYDEIKREVLGDSAVWSFKFGNAAKDTISEVGFVTDNPFHKAFKAVLQPGFSARALQDYMAKIEVIAKEHIDAMLTHGEGDFHDEFALPVPAKVMCLMLGLPLENYMQYKRWSDQLQAMLFHDTTPGSHEAIIGEIVPYFMDQINDRRRQLTAAGITQPGVEHLGTVLSEDYISRCVVSQVEGRPFTDGEIINVCMGFLTGGQETTTNLICNLTWRLLQVPERWETLKANPDLIEAAVEESLRHDPPVLAHFRTSLCPVTMHGHELPEHSKLMFNIAGANRDPEKFEDPESFRLDRPLSEARQHLSFGAGVHLCLGAPIARMEAKIAMRMLIERLPKLRLNGEGERIYTWMYWGRKKLPVAWS